jgi:maltooligosyltrehalose trehalohydrolase
VRSGTKETVRRLTVGAELLPEGGADVRVWAPACARVDLVRADTNAAFGMEREPDGYFHVLDPDARAGGRYWFRLDGPSTTRAEGDRLRPDPASRYQPDGPHKPSAYVDPHAFQWTDGDWRGVGRSGHVMYELHVGTFTREGTWRAAARELEALADIGITVIEMMPIAEFPGRFGWGYDGVGLYAPVHAYGTPDDLRGFVDRAHALGVAVILDVVYNHLGPDGNYLHEFSPEYFTNKYKNDWGRAINFEGPKPARQYFVENAGYWVDEFHFDGLRLDATQDVKDSSPRHVIAEIVESARAAAGSRSLFIVAENEAQETRIVRSPADTDSRGGADSGGGWGADALWNDDAHHTAVVALTGRREAYYRDYQGSPQELVSCARFGYLYQGQWYEWQQKPRGTPALDLVPENFVAYLENHDQIANSPYGHRLWRLGSPGCYRALTAWLMLGPATPLLFQGQEYGSSKPFLYFADHGRDLSEAVRRGRAEFLSQFPSITDARVAGSLPDPGDPCTFDACKLDFTERRRHQELYALHRDLLALRRRDAVLSTAGRRRPEGAVLGPGAFLLRYIDREYGDRLLVVNLGGDLDFTPAREPLIAPPFCGPWRLEWSSESPDYGGQGTRPSHFDESPVIPGACALLFVADVQGVRWRKPAE